MRIGNNTPAFDRSTLRAPAEAAPAENPIAQLPGRIGTIRIFDQGLHSRTIDPPATTSGKGGWDSLGVLSSSMLGGASSGLSAVRGQAHEKSLNGGGEWRDVQSFGPNAWSLDVTAELLSGNVRC